MNYADDEASIKNAIWKRLFERGKTEIAAIEVEEEKDAVPPYIRVSIWFVLKDRVQMEGIIDPRSFFDLPAEFTHAHLLNEIDEIAEQLKEVRRKTAIDGLLWRPGATQPRQEVNGTGLRGRWGENVSNHN